MTLKKEKDSIKFFLMMVPHKLESGIFSVFGLFPFCVYIFTVIRDQYHFILSVKKSFVASILCQVDAALCMLILTEYKMPFSFALLTLDVALTPFFFFFCENLFLGFKR